MADQQPIDDALLAKFLAGETDPDESARVQQWLDGDSSVASTTSPDDFVRFERIWQTATPADQSSINTDAAWKAVHQKMRGLSGSPGSQPEPTIKPLPVQIDALPAQHRSIWSRPIWRIAAVLLLALGAGWLALRFRGQQPPPGEQTFLTLTTTTQSLNKTLSDGTKILLNRHSTLHYPATFADDHRDVTLTGEAFFDVSPDATRPFRIQARETTVQVLGTSFNVRAYDANVSVAVRTGKVRFAGGRKAVVLTPNQQATFVAGADTLRQILQVSPNVFAYKTRQLVFDKEPLRNVVQTINTVYQADVRLGSARLGNCLLSTRFDKLPLDDVIAITAETLQLRVRRVGQQVVLEGDGCQ
ncbi:iron dicitrate transport regulator FecR [Spirosoma taeanense]|uniref:Iron dicitrate transport regulator FecR n=1 Tax=Spirosoma taeanense TaxID=2735870 RepID=A0A6M5Y3Z0_9BACT|nr:FecR domain-containing protein [Spirosoma taeanense]QJW88529.1 iron dicitrate transport regulator FecR [Spirosoma taeanense]